MPPIDHTNEPQRRGNGSDFSAEGFGVKLATRGGAVVLILALAIIASVFYGWYRLDQTLVRTNAGTEGAITASANRAEAASKEIVKAIEKGMDTGGAQHKALERSQALTACIIAYPVDQRGPMRTASSYEAFRQFCPWLP